MKTSEQINEIAAALAKAQSAIVNPGKDSENPAFKANGKTSRYASLAEALVIVRKELSAVGIAVLQAPRIDGDAKVLDTRLIHSSGQWVGCEWPAGSVGATPHQQGSALTYARRYSLFSLVGIAGADDDDDGNEASGRVTYEDDYPEGRVVHLPNRKISETQVGMIRTALDALTDKGIEAAMLKAVGVEKVTDIPASKAEKVMSNLSLKFHEQAQKAGNASAADLAAINNSELQR